MEKDKVKYPECGVIYDGDYYRPLPFSDYIHKETLEEWLTRKEIVNPIIIDPRDFGAVPDGQTLSTEALQAAADEAGKDSIVVFHIAGGHYVSGSLRIHSGTILYIEADSAIAASKNPDKMNPTAFISFDKAEKVILTGGGKVICNGEYYVNLPLNRPRLTPLPYTKVPPVLFDKMGYPVDTIRYAYRSRIRYAGDPYSVNEDGNDVSIERYRPAYSVLFSHCKDVEIENIIIEDAMSWTLVLDNCEHVKIRDTVINDNRHVANADGIDIMNSSDVSINHCFISSADDGICLKSPRIRSGEGAEAEKLRREASVRTDTGKRKTGCRDIKVRDCTVVSVMNGIKIGTETYFDIEDIDISDCRLMLPDIYPGMTGGIAVESCDGALIRKVRIRNITMDKVVCPLMILLNKRNKYGFHNDDDKRERENGGEIRNVLIENVRATDAEIPSLITGFMYRQSNRKENQMSDTPLTAAMCRDLSAGDDSVTETTEGTLTERRIKDTVIRNFEVIYNDNKESISFKNSVAENVDDYPESNAFGDLPAYGLYIRHADNVKLENVHIKPRSMNTRPEIVKEFAD
ncbi:MAG: hypothetical protein E7232_13850 [Lachnospiraceae bacterium]|nr:hypothetical protein [Lachnospiraceae bacterium]